MSNFRQSLMGGRPSLAGRQSLLGRPSSGIPRLTSTPAGGNSGNPNSNISGPSSSHLAPKLNAGPRHLSRTTSEVYHFPLLKVQAIVSCLADVQISWTEDELARPTPQKMLLVYETFLDILTGKLRDDCTMNDIQSMEVTAYPVWAFTNMMYEVGVTDFTSRDVTKPEAERVRRVLSAVINFAKFKEDRQGFFMTELESSEELLEAIDDCDREHEQLSLELDTHKQRKLAQEPKVEEQKAINERLADDLQTYQRREHDVKRRKDEVTKERRILNERQTVLLAALEKTTEELNALQAQRVDVPETLEQDLVQIPQSISSLQADINQRRKQVQGQYAAVERMETVRRDLVGVLEVMSDALNLLDQSHRDAAEVDSVKSQIERENLNMSTYKAKLEQMERQIKGLDEKSSSLARTHKTRREQQEIENAELEKERLEAEEKLRESRRVLDETRRRRAEILQREQMWADEVTAAMENVKFQVECYQSVALEALRLN
ncbi:kinetochore-associated Ndc80 complex subunit nuf2 [Dissophora globulifera]|nr:kinetochore-associated Ndc80 complex subunit nuf2 [Dissophora globulifera]